MTEAPMFAGRVALITGAGRGLGLAHAETLARGGCRVVLNDLAGEDAPHHAAAERLRAEGHDAVALDGSVAEPATARALVAATTDRFGRLDILINNAGFLRDRTFRKMTPEDFDAVLDVHLRGPAHATHAAWGVMCAQDYGRILNTASTSALYGAFGQANYDAAKMGLIGLQNALKLEGRGHGITINTIAPLAATRLADEAFPPAIRTVMTLDWVAAVAAHLVSEACTASGLVLEVAAGHVAGVRVMESAGAMMTVATPDAAKIAIAAATEQPHDIGFDGAAEAVAKILGAAIQAGARQ